MRTAWRWGGLEHRVEDGFDHGGLFAKHGLMHCPLEAVSSHALVSVEPGELGELGELTKRYILTVAVEIFQVLLGQLIELRPTMERATAYMARPRSSTGCLCSRKVTLPAAEAPAPGMRQV
jgi:hypothetical protein